MRRFLVLLVVGLAITVTSSVAIFAQQGATGSAQLHPISQSGIRAQINFLDTGSATNGLVVSGNVIGLNPTQAYFSLIYDKRSVPGGPVACEPSSSNPLTLSQMIVGFWTVAANGTGTLFVTKTGSSYVPLTDFDSISVRIVLGPPPEGFVLQACGQVHRNP